MFQAAAKYTRDPSGSFPLTGTFTNEPVVYCDVQV